MTQAVIFGISVGAEPQKEQREIGVSFTDVRCKLIAKALMDDCANQATAKRLTFVDYARKLLVYAQIVRRDCRHAAVPSRPALDPASPRTTLRPTVSAFC
jgi:hypothetical protein